MRLHFTAVEASGDLLARETMEAIVKRQPGCEFSGIGGAEMARLGIETPFDTSPLAVLGLVEGLKAYPTVIRLADRAADHIIAAQPDAAVLVDSWGFCLRVGQRVRARAPGIRLVKLAGPQVWASRPGRARTLAMTFDQVLCLHRMELPHYAALPIRADLIGVPALSRSRPGDRARFCKDHGVDPERPILLVLPGSRRSELEQVAPALVEAALLAGSARPDLQLVAMPAASIREGFLQRFAEVAPRFTLVRPDAPQEDAMAAADLALACSGTVTSEVAMQGTPMLVAYRLGALTFMLARRIFRFRHVSLINIAAGDVSVMPEFIQHEMVPGAMTAKALELLASPEALADQVARQNEALVMMGHGERPAAERAAEAILDGLRKTIGFTPTSSAAGLANG